MDGAELWSGALWGSSKLDILWTWKGLWESEEVKPHQKQFHILTLKLSGMLGGWGARCQLGMSLPLLVTSVSQPEDRNLVPSGLHQKRRKR